MSIIGLQLTVKHGAEVPITSSGGPVLKMFWYESVGDSQRWKQSTWHCTVWHCHCMKGKLPHEVTMRKSGKLGFRNGESPHPRAARLTWWHVKIPADKGVGSTARTSSSVWKSLCYSHLHLFPARLHCRGASFWQGCAFRVSGGSMSNTRLLLPWR